MAQPTRAIVIGGGIGGLTAAAALHRRGLDVTVLERAPSLEPVGAAISLAPNALRALDVLGIGDEIRDLAAWQGDGGLRTPRGRWLSRSSAEAAEARFGGPLVLLPRATLVDRLAALLPPGTVRTAAAATLADPGDRTRPARVTAGTTELEADLVVGADGVHSRVRGTLFPEHPGAVYAGFTTWRVLIPVPGVEFASHETWGRGHIWGTHPLKDGRVYAYAAATAPAGERVPDDERAELLRRYGDWHQPIPSVLAAARPEDVLRHDVHHIARPLPAHHRGRVALLGDAAHAMPPTLGQGGNQAIEDAVVLAHHAADLPAYTAARLPRTTAIARQAVRVGRLNMAGGRAVVAVRDTAVAALSKAGPALFLRGFDGIADWRPPYAADQTHAGKRDRERT
ncbi:2-polyprenyl-6-methoxyphenol hydroxylase [Streptomyces sp. 1222.5]|uniref:FAD-dependent monooxygenase n=1 Tax=unclassified Streptomyces TaxID=2593676 RepID=UPI0008986EDE|nr:MULTISPECIES: FAD-dependent monooxygenase [unclassified Streptomyces]PKW06400.1 2-polyprenyl-6-methoxyphenol hydroxylase-like FAD-dependent oxidoreductase [Streptomyces sp. 5112.2]SED13811.1 2-polyprenyl-6-methoxyphenol hydroxylase [Streptomyces sp. 1222.5]